MATIQSSPFESIILTNDSVDSREWPQLTCGAANQLALGVAELPVDSRLGLHFQGPGQISSSSNELTIIGELTVSNNLTVGEAIASPTVSVTGTVTANALEVAGEIKASGIIRANAFRPPTDDWEIARNGEHLEIREPEEGGRVWARFNDNSSLHLIETPNLLVNGNVGIGTTNPAFPLSLGSSLGTTKLALYETGADNSYGLGVLAGQFRLHLNGNQARFAFFDSDRADANEIVTIGGSGNVHVKGGLFVNNVPFRDRGNAQYDTSTKQFCYDNSSRQTKENITPLKDDFYKILQVEPKTYTRPGDPERWEIGYIAEEFHDLGLNKLIYYDEDGSPEAINYPKICMYLVPVIRDLIQRINDLDEKTKDYEQRIQQLEQQTG